LDRTADRVSDIAANILKKFLVARDIGAADAFCNVLAEASLGLFLFQFELLGKSACLFV
jgi:hypothetical protein